MARSLPWGNQIAVKKKKFVKDCKKHLSLKPAALDDVVNELKARHHQSISCIRHAPKNIKREC